MDADEKLDIIAKLMKRIPERKPKHDITEQLCETATILHGENSTVVALAKHCENDALKLRENAPLNETIKMPKLCENIVELHGENASKVDLNDENNDMHSHDENTSANETLKVDETVQGYNAVSAGKKMFTNRWRWFRKS